MDNISKGPETLLDTPNRSGLQCITVENKKMAGYKYQELASLFKKNLGMIR